MCIVYNVLGIVLQYGISKLMITNIWECLLTEVFEIFGLQMFRISSYYSNFTLWYIAVLIFISSLIYTIISKHEYYFVNLFSPLVAIFGYALVYQNGGHLGLDYNVKFIYIFNAGMWRGLSGICVGILLYKISNLFKKKVDSIRIAWRELVYLLSNARNCLSVICYETLKNGFCVSLSGYINNFVF